jgi:hypothetical protein
MDYTRAFESVPQDGGAFESGFLIAFVVVGAIVLAGFVFVGYAMVRSARAARRSGIDPFTPESVLIADALRGQGGQVGRAAAGRAGRPARPRGHQRRGARRGPSQGSGGLTLSGPARPGRSG